jgi:hypothetical protein
MNKVPQRNVSFSDDQWDALDEAARGLGITRGSLIRELIGLGWHHTSCDTPFNPKLPGERSPFER